MGPREQILVAIFASGRRILAQAPNKTALRRAHDGIMSRTTNLLIAHVHLHQNCQDLGDRGTAHADTRSVDSQPRSVWSRARP